MGIVREEFLNGDVAKPLYREWDNGVWYRWEYDYKGREVKFELSDGQVDVCEYDDSRRYTQAMQQFCEAFASEVGHGNWKKNHFDIYIRAHNDGTYGLQLYGLGKVNWSLGVVESYEPVYGPLVELMGSTDLGQFSEIHVQFYCGTVKEVALKRFDVQEKSMVSDGPAPLFEVLERAEMRSGCGSDNDRVREPEIG